MKRVIVSFIVVLPVCLTSCEPPASKPTITKKTDLFPEPKSHSVDWDSIRKADDPVVEITTSKGVIKAVLYRDRAPITVENFLRYTKDKHYDETIFHRVIAKFMIQGGGYEANMEEKNTAYPAILNEARNGLPNERGTLAMARTSDIDSATAQFFINVKDNPFLDHSQKNFGYAVFGKVIEGMDVVDAIRFVQTGPYKGHENVPNSPVSIKSIRVVESKE